MSFGIGRNLNVIWRLLMRQELDDKLCQAFPLLYKDRNKSKQQTCFAFGFEHSDGWFDIIWELSSKLEPLIQKWLDENPDAEEYEQPCVGQCKEKFGTLRYYFNSSTDEMEKHIAEAEAKSCKTCEECGKDGSLRGGSWLITLCDDCQKEREFKKKLLQDMYDAKSR